MPRVIPLRGNFQGATKCWLDLSDAEIEDVLQRLLPNENGGYDYEDFLSLCHVDMKDRDAIRRSGENITVEDGEKASRDILDEASDVRKNLAASGAFEEGDLPASVEASSDGEEVGVDLEPTRKIAIEESITTDALVREAEERQRKAAAVSIQQQIRARQARACAVRKRNARLQLRRRDTAAVEIQKHMRSRLAHNQVAEKMTKKNNSEQKSGKIGRQTEMESAAEDLYSENGFDEDMDIAGASDYDDDFESGIPASPSKELKADRSTISSEERSDAYEYGDDFED